MDIPSYWLAIALGLSAVGCVVLVLRVLRLAPFPGRNHFLAVQAALIWWITSDAIEHLQTVQENALFWAEFAHLGIVTGPSAWGLFVWNYIYGRYRPSPRILDWIAFLFGFAIWVLALTNAHHHLIYREILTIGKPPNLLFQYTHGPVYGAYHIALFLVALVSYGVILYSIVNADRVYRVHYIGFALSTALPWITNFLYLTGALPDIPFDTSPLTFYLITGIFYWLIRKRQMFDLLPIAHGMLLDIIPDPILVVDNQNRIEECNSAARQLLGDRSLVGLNLADLPGWHGDPSEAGIGDPPRYFDLGNVPLTYAGNQVGRLLLLRDITRLKQLQDQLKEQAIRDPLTGLHNRRFLAELAPVLIAEAERSGQSLALVLLDIDHFKKLNDGFGHPAGDAVLRALGAFLRQNIRQSDAVVRFGGEEFLLLMPYSGVEQALARVEAWRSGFSSAPVTHDGQALNTTFSAGLALYPEDAKTLDELIDCADAALYRAKAEGRNRSVHWQAGMG